MKINVFVQLLDEKGRLNKAERGRFEKKLDSALRSLADGEARYEPAYRLSLSDSAQRASPQKAVVARDQNEDFRRPLRQEATAIERPQSVSDLGRFSFGRLKEALVGVEQSLSELAKAHSSVDRNRVAQILIS